MNTDHTINENDVLCGRGGGTNNHKGNIKFRQNVSSRQSSYLNAQKAEKKVLAASIVHQIRQKGGRFLKYNDRGELEDIGDIKANEKTCQALREGINIRTHIKERTKRNGQISSSFYPPQNRNFNYQSSEVHNAYYGTNPRTFFAQANSRPTIGQNYNRVAHQQQHFNHNWQQQRPTHNYYYEEPQRHIGGCNCTMSNCLKLYCRCFSKSNFCQPSVCHCKDCHNTSDHMQEVNEAISKISEKNISPFYKDVADASNHNARTTDNQHLFGNQHGPSQKNAAFSYPSSYDHCHEMSSQNAAPFAMNSHHSPMSSISPCNGYCKCFNAGIKCSGNCQRANSKDT